MPHKNRLIEQRRNHQLRRQRFLFAQLGVNLRHDVQRRGTSSFVDGKKDAALSSIRAMFTCGEKPSLTTERPALDGCPLES